VNSCAQAVRWWWSVWPVQHHETSRTQQSASQRRTRTVL
jgi:hypothetical protein